MTSRISHVSVDCHDAYALSVWWAAVLGMHEVPDDPNQPGDEECMLVAEDNRIPVLFLQVPEGKTVKNRVHFDLRPTEGSRDAEIARVRGLGATLVDDRRTGDGRGWMVLADPEGNEFCILRSDAELAGG